MRDVCLRRRFAAEGCWERTGKCDRKSSVCESIGRVVGNVTERMIGSQLFVNLLEGLIGT